MSAVKSNINNYMMESQVLLDKLQADEPGFTKLSALLKEKAGINMVLNDKNLTLMASRLNSVLKKHQLKSYKEYIRAMEENPEKFLPEFIVCLTTNTTQFYREPIHFDYLAKKLPEILERKEQEKNYELRIWCSATSTGQEVYTIMMVLLKHIQNLTKWNIKFLATDIDYEVLQRASSGIYGQNEIGGIPSENLKKYFDEVEDRQEIKYQFKAEYRRIIRFATFNLLTDKYPFKYPFDIAFCRNVLIYFDRETSAKVIDKIAHSLGPKGLLFLGHSETGMLKSKYLKAIASATYEKV